MNEMEHKMHSFICQKKNAFTTLFVIGDKGMILGLVKHESLILVAKSMNLIKKCVWICKHDVSVLSSL